MQGILPWNALETHLRGDPAELFASHQSRCSKVTGDCGRTNSGYGGIEKWVQTPSSPLHSSEQLAPPIPPGAQPLLL